MKELSTRTGYIDADATLDEVLLFIPNESVWAFIHERDPQLIDVALRQKVVLCSPVSLFAVLAVIRQAVEQTRLARTSNEILECLAGFGQQWTKFAEALDKVVKPVRHRAAGPRGAHRARAAASSSASSTASRTSGPAAACPTLPARRSGDGEGEVLPARQRRRAPLGRPRGRLTRSPGGRPLSAVTCRRQMTPRSEALRGERDDPTVCIGRLDGRGARAKPAPSRALR